ncbi:MAG TPA: PhzF family phenazine biosynthesis protein [Nitrososphaerales archaeon]|nr:PhzF family phenazine biosynthesis protein [Nitrososphaerales archaeon]
MRFYIVDVFAETKYSGNQLAVFRDSGKLTSAQMQRIAQEMHYSETTFITSEKEREGGYDVRIFTPDQELPFAGHPTLGTAYILQSEIIKKPVPQVRLNLKVGQIPVTLSYKRDRAGILWMKQKEPSFSGELDPRPVAEFLGLTASDLDERFPVMDVSTGLPFLVVPLKNLKAVKRIQFDRTKYVKFAENTSSKIVLVFSPETYKKENDLNVRVIGPSLGVPEDPATGSGNGCLAAYLVKQQYFGRGEIDVRVEQGYEINRKSLLLLRAKITSGAIEVNVGGRVQFIARGELPE